MSTTAGDLHVHLYATRHFHLTADTFRHEFRGKWPKAVTKVVDDAEQLLGSYDFPRRALGPPQGLQRRRGDVLDP